MKTWERAKRLLVCGSCATAISPGDPVLTISSPTGRDWKLARCASCAGVPVPADLEPYQPPAVAIPVTRKAPKAWNKLPHDYKLAQSGDDE